MSARVLLALRTAAPLLSSNRLPSSLLFAPRFYSSETTEPVTILARLRNDVKEAMKSRDKARTSILKSVLSDLTYSEKASSTGAKLTTDSEVAPLVQQAIVTRKDSVFQYRSAGREDLATKEQGEIELLETYLPKQMSEVEIEEATRTVCEAVGAKSLKDMGKVLKELKIDPAKAHKQAISVIVKKVLTELGKA